MALVRIQAELFEDQLPQAGDDFAAAFDAWVLKRRTRHRMLPASAAVYEDMWNAFARWCQQECALASLDTLDEELLTRFLSSRTGSEVGGELSARYVWRLLNLIDRVLDQRAIDLGQAKNAAAASLIERDAAVRRANINAPPPPDYLPSDDARRLVIHLARAETSSKEKTSRRWQELRNRAAVALQLGSGLTPGELRALHCDSVVIAGGPLSGVPWRIRVADEATRAARETPIARWAGKVLRDWITFREGVCFPADLSLGAPIHWLFPSTQKHGNQWPKVAHWEAVNAVLSQAKLVAPTGGSFRLRHTFALRQLRRGTPPADVARWMGIVDVVEMERYRNILLDQDVV